MQEHTAYSGEASLTPLFSDVSVKTETRHPLSGSTPWRSVQYDIPDGGICQSLL